MDGRHTLTSEERAQSEEIEKTLVVSSYLEEVYEAIHTGAPPKIQVPNYKEPTKGELLGAVHSNTPLPHEQEGMNMNFDELYKLSGVSVPPAAVPAPKSADSSIPHITQNQWKAIKKYPGLVEFLGQSHGEKIAREISEQVNIVLAKVVEKNSRHASKHAVDCKADRQNLKQYFQTDDWICRVTASGPFCEDDAIFYSREEDIACILRKSGPEGFIKYADVSSRFNIIFESSVVAKQADVEPIEENNEENDAEDNDIVPAPVDTE